MYKFPDMRAISRAGHSVASWAATSILILLVLSGCGPDVGDGNNAPVLTFVGINKPSLFQSSSVINDSILVRLEFEDIDGDLAGLGDGMIPDNIVIVDTRDNSEEFTSFPRFPTDLTNGQRGQLDLTIRTTCCLFDIFDPCMTGLDTFNIYPYDIYIVDSQGNRSNVVSTDPVMLLCP